jgi:hypothetical protein
MNAYRNGWLFSYANDNIATYGLPSPLHTAYLSDILDPRSFEHPYKSLQHLCVDVLRGFKPSQLFTPYRRAGLLTPETATDARYHDEFYRSMHDLLRGAVIMTPEFITRTSSDGVGRIDFFLPADAWGIELTRHSELHAYSDIFGPNGAYRDPELKDYILLDCRPNRPGLPHPRKCVS